MEDREIYRDGRIEKCKYRGKRGPKEAHLALSSNKEDVISTFEKRKVRGKKKKT